MARPSLILLLAAGLVGFLLLHTFNLAPSFSPLVTAPNTASTSSILEEQRAFWQSFAPYLLLHGPHCEPIIHSEVGDLSIGYDATDHTVLRPDRLNVSGMQLVELRSAHTKFTTHLTQEKYTLPVIKNSRGIVTTAGGKYLPVAVVSIRMLRETGSTLPVEVFLASRGEWDAQICDNVFPSMNACCVVLADIFDIPGQKTVEIDKYQYKVMSIVFSSFEEVLFLDADAFPIFDPGQYFDSEPFKTTGMIRWPDFWMPSESPSSLKSPAFLCRRFGPSQQRSRENFTMRRRSIRDHYYWLCITTSMAQIFTILFSLKEHLERAIKRRFYGPLLSSTSLSTL